MRLDSKEHFALSPLQTPFAVKLLEKYGCPTDLSTIAVIDDSGASIKMTAVNRILQYLGLPAAALGTLGLRIPTFLSDPVYDTVAQNRGDISKYWPFSHNIEAYKDRMLGLEGQTVKEASADPRNN